MTLQTAAPLPRLSMSTTNRPMDTLLHWADNHNSLDMDQPYQRGHVWGLTRRRNLIRSIIMGIPIPSLIVNDRMGAKFSEPTYDQDRNWAYAIIDGKQRTTTIIMWLRSEFAVPASWFGPDLVSTPEPTTDGIYVRFSGLTIPAQRGMRNRTIGVAEGKFGTLTEERMVFDLVNFGGLAQGERDTDA